MKNAVALSILVVIVLLFFGCDQGGELDSQDLTAEETAEIEQATNEVLQEVERLTRTYDATLSNARKSGNYVYVPAGSNDALADALAEVGPRGVVVLAPGEHYESQTVAVTHRVVLFGEPGARLIVDTQPISSAGTVDPALHVMDASHVVIWGLEFLPKGEVGGTAVLAERAPHLIVGRTTIKEHQIGVILDRTDNARIIHNTLEMSTNLAPGENTQGIIVVNGTHVAAVSNTVSKAAGPGIFISSEHGRLIRNHLSGNIVGVLLCQVPGLPAPSGDILSADVSATQWILAHNNAHDNAWGYLFIDGVTENLLTNTNRASNNAYYDIELAGDTERFGFFSPTSFENRAFVRFSDVTVKDCGVDNRVRGGKQVDTGADPCF